MKTSFVHSTVLCLIVLFLWACGGRNDSSHGNRNSGAGNAASNAANETAANSSNNSNLPSSGPLNTNTSNSNSEITETSASVSAALLQMEDAWNAAYVKRDEAWFQQNLADDYSEIGDDGKTINDRPGAISAMKTDKSTAIETELSDLKVRVEGNAAVVTGVNHVRLKDSTGKQQDYKHRFTDTYIERNGRWLIWANESTKMP